MELPRLQLTAEESDAAADAWAFNCGPAALCAVLGLKPEEVRKHLSGFEGFGYMNAVHMADALRSAARARLIHGFHGYLIKDGRANKQLRGVTDDVWPAFGVVRVQWNGPWLEAGAPPSARLRYTHWIAHAKMDHKRMVFDINAILMGGWILLDDWHAAVVPALTKDIRRAYGTYHPSYAFDLRLREEGSSS